MHKLDILLNVQWLDDPINKAVTGQSALVRADFTACGYV